MYWLLEVTNFILKMKLALKRKKVVCFALSYIINDMRKFCDNRIIKNFEKVYKSIDPIDTIIFGGKIIKIMPLSARLFFGGSKKIPLDNGDNNKTEEWVKDLIKCVSL